MSLRAEQVVDGRYRVLERLGSGGMADVFLAEDLQLGRNVALKVLHGRFAEDREFVERFRREASSAAGLQHPNVVAVYDRGEVDGTSYIAMEHVQGRSLKDIVNAEAPLDPDRAVGLVVQVLRAARFAHRRGIVHRDLKPQNILVDDTATPPVAKVADFGIARAGTASQMTQTGSIMGTAQYLSPEQAQGHAVSARSDLYSVGVVLYELLTGRVPFDGDSAVTVALKQVNEQPVPPSRLNPAVTPELDHAVLRAMAKDPADRFADADEFTAVLEAARSRLGRPGPPRPTGTVPPQVAAAYATGPHTIPPGPVAAVAAEEEDRRSSRWLVALGVLVAALVLGALLLFGGGREVQVPNVVGAQQAVAEQRLQREGFEVTSVTRRSDREEGTVIATSPAPGTRVEEGSEVRLTVSGGPGTVAVPAVEGLPRSQALRALRAAGLVAEEERVTSAEVPENRVVEVVPGEGQQVPRGSEVTLRVSRGPARAVVPSVVGQTRAEATSTLENAGFAVQVDEQESTSADPGTVTAQDPEAGAAAAEGSTVTITVARAPEEVDVPDVTGEQADDAVRTLSGAGFEVRQVEREVATPDGDGTVVEQRPAGGKAARGSTVTIVVARFDPDLDPEGTQTGTRTTDEPEATTPTTTPGTP